MKVDQRTLVAKPRLGKAPAGLARRSHKAKVSRKFKAPTTAKHSLKPAHRKHK